jgi:thiol-disulfide isomerase/thioredoxin
MDETLNNEPAVDQGPRGVFNPVPWLIGVAAVAAIALVALFSGAADQADPDVAAGAGSAELEEFARLAFLTEEGQEATLADFQGEALVVNFFASWCAPCRAELPEFEEVHLANGGAVTFLGISHDLDETTWRALIAETDITFQTVFQPNSDIWSELDAKGMPSTAFISPDGELMQLWTGVLNAEKLQELIDENLLEAA